jgi:hypothetical protein
MACFPVAAQSNLALSHSARLVLRFPILPEFYQTAPLPVWCSPLVNSHVAPIMLVS